MRGRFRIIKRAASTIVCLAVCVALVFGTPSAASAKVLGTDMVSKGSVSARALTVALAPDVSAQTGILIDSEGKVLWSREPDTSHAMASITKLMTAIVAVESARLDDEFTVSVAAARVGESSSGLRAGDRLPLETLIKALLVSSGNDASVAIAEGIAGDIESFAAMMNDKAVELGLSNTHFKNPHGLDADGHLTTASDLAVIVRYAMGIDIIRETVALDEFTLDYGNRTALLRSTNDLLSTYEGANGLKTGFTDAAGYCLSAGAQRDGIQLYAVVLGAPTASQRFADCSALLDWGFAHYKSLKLATAMEPMAVVPVTDLIDGTVTAVVSEDIIRPVFDFDGALEQRITLLDVVSPIAPGDQIGTVTWLQGPDIVATAKLVSVEQVERPGVFGRLSISLTRAWRSIFGGQKVAERRVLADTPIVPDPFTIQGEQ